MAHTRSNKKPEKSKKQRVRTFTGTCSKCGKRGIDVVKVKGSQMCTSCLNTSIGRQPGVNVMDLIKDALKTPATNMDHSCNLAEGDGFVDATPSTVTMPSLPPVE